MIEFKKTTHRNKKTDLLKKRFHSLMVELKKGSIKKIITIELKKKTDKSFHSLMLELNKTDLLKKFNSLMVGLKKSNNRINGGIKKKQQ